MKKQKTDTKGISVKTEKPKHLMKRLMTVTAVLGLAACGTGVASAQSSAVLFNGDLNQVTAVDTSGSPPVGWTALGIQTLNFPGGGWLDCEASEPWCNGINDPNPAGYGIFFKPFEGSTNADPALNNLASCYFYQDNPSSANTSYTLSAYVGAQENYSGYQVGAPNDPVTALYVMFMDNSGSVIASNAFDLVAAGLENLGTGATPSSQYTTPAYTAPVGTVTVRAGLMMLNTWGTTGQQSLFADNFDLEATAAPGSPAITSQPTGTTVTPGGNASFTVVTTPAATSYLWTLNNNPVYGPEFSGTNSATLIITGASTNDVGHYQVLASNSSGSNRSAIVPLALNGLNLFPTITLIGTIGDTYEIDRSDAVNGTWIPYSTNTLTVVPQYITDFTLPVSPSEFYRQIFVH